MRACTVPSLSALIWSGPASKFVYGVVDSNGCVKELDRRVMTEAEAAVHRELRDEASGSA